MNQDYIQGFLKRASQAGIDEATARALLAKAANHPGADPGLGAGGPPPGAGAPPPDAGGAVPGGLAGAPGDSGVPPELEQIINSLPPEVLAQLVQEIEAELSQGGAGGAGHGGHAGGHPHGAPQGPPPGMGAGGPPPGAGGPPMPPKQGSDAMVAKQASYIEGFMKRAFELGIDQTSAKNIYKQALQIMEGQTIQTKTQPKQTEKNAHFEGFIEKAASYGLNQAQAEQLYHKTFGK